MNDIINIVGLAALVNLLVEAEPIRWMKDKIGLTSQSKYSAVRFFARLTGCCLCLGTYVGIISTMSFAEGAVVAVLAELINRKLNTFNI
jgi:hypothetical protein